MSTLLRPTTQKVSAGPVITLLAGISAWRPSASIRICLTTPRDCASLATSIRTRRIVGQRSGARRRSLRMIAVSIVNQSLKFEDESESDLRITRAGKFLSEEDTRTPLF